MWEMSTRADNEFVCFQVGNTGCGPVESRDRYVIAAQPALTLSQWGRQGFHESRSAGGNQSTEYWNSLWFFQTAFFDTLVQVIKFPIT